MTMSTTAAVGAAAETEAQDTVSELPAMAPRRARAVTQADAAEFAVAAEAAEHRHTPSTKPPAAVGPSDFELLCVIGQGAFGKVIQVRHAPSGDVLAMKVVSNKYIVKHNSVAYLQTERDIMTKEGLLLESAAKFYAAEMVLALEHLHGHGIIHRSRSRQEDDSAKTMCGTHEYMAPEMIRGKALPKWLSSDTHSILKQLLERTVDKRLGSGKSTMFQVKGVQAIKKHAFFRDIDWHLLAQKKLAPPIVPSVESNTDTSYFSEEFTKLAVGRPSAGAEDDAAKLFDRFSFIAEDMRSYASVVAGELAADAAAPSDALAELQHTVVQLQLESGSA
ncbi:hypothetical protein PybrP1_003117 [[Pythium] brassicae (nom. inval.)]|nr:hypothetical protein PybrP1_003117 [[Pythium] brassicae (nom. inval.)]